MALKEYADKDGRTYLYDEDNVPAGHKLVAKASKPAENKAAKTPENKSAKTAVTPETVNTTPAKA